MADKSFEQRVKSELSDLRMKPAASVWTGVEAALHQERKRRWLVWLFLLAGVAGAFSLGYYYFNHDKKEIAKTAAQIQSLPKEETKEITARKNTPPVISETQNQKKTAQETTLVATPTEKPMDRAGIKQTIIAAVKNIPVKSKTTRDALVVQKTEGDGVVKSKQDRTVYDDPKTQNATTVEKSTTNGLVNNNKSEIEKQTGIMQQDVPVKDPASVSAKTEEKTTEPLPVTPIISSSEPPVAATVVKTKKNKWQWNISVDAGSSGLRDAIKLPGLSAFRDALVAAPTPPTNTVPAPLLTVEPAVKDAFSFGMQLQATKQLGKKHRVGFSAGYSLFQTSMNVGRRIDSTTIFNSNAGAFSSGIFSSSFYYTNTDSTAYTNKYHFLRLGADLYTPFRLFKKIAFQWQVGVGVNILAATNGLHYDGTTKKLFSNNALYAKTQSYISTGIDLSIGKTPFLYIGPHWQYSFTNLTNKLGGNQHLFLSSVKVSFVLPKKKK
jgi:hypothetical protein